MKSDTAAKTILEKQAVQTELSVSPGTFSLSSGKRLQNIFYRGFSIHNICRALRAQEEKYVQN